MASNIRVMQWRWAARSAGRILLAYRWRIAPGFAAFWLAAVSLVRGASVADQLVAIYRPSSVEAAALAPNGAHVALAVHATRGFEIHVLDAAGATVNRFPLAARNTSNAPLLAWLSPEWLLAASDAPVVIGINAHSGVVTKLVDPGTFRRVVDGQTTNPAVRVIYVSPEEGHSVLLEVTTPGNESFRVSATIQLYRCDVVTGERTRVLDRLVEPPGDSVIVDRQGEPRILFERGNLPQRFLYRGTGDASWTNLDSALADKQAFRFAVTPDNYLGERTIPLGFDFDPNVLYYASNVGRDTFAVHAVDLRTGHVLAVQGEDSGSDLATLDLPWTNSPLVFDQHRRRLVGIRSDLLNATTRWFDPELAAVQTALTQDFPARVVRLLDWDARREQFLVLIGSPAIPDRFVVYRRASGTYLELSDRGWLHPDDVNQAEPFSFTTAENTTLTGCLTLPHAPPVAKPALIIWFHDGPWQCVLPTYDRDAQALAAMGFAVARINYRGSVGLGRAFREALSRDFTNGPIDDALAAKEWLAHHYNLDPKRVAVAGEGFGGYLALRAVELHSDSFRAAIAINAILDFEHMRESATEIEGRQRAMAALHESGLPGSTAARDFLNAGASPMFAPGADGGAASADAVAAAAAQEEQKMRAAAEQQLAAWSSIPLPNLDMSREVSRRVFHGFGLKRFSVGENVGQLTKPVLLLHDPTDREHPIGPVRQLRDTLAARKLAPEYMEVPASFGSGPPGMRAPALVRMGQFLNLNLYDFQVKIGEVIEKDR